MDLLVNNTLGNSSIGKCRKCIIFQNLSAYEELPPAQDAEEKANNKENNSRIQTYKWSQDNEDVTLKFEVPDGTTKESIVCEIKTDSMSIRIGEDILLSGTLFAKVKSEESTWTLDKNRYLGLLTLFLYLFTYELNIALHFESVYVCNNFSVSVLPLVF